MLLPYPTPNMNEVQGGSLAGAARLWTGERSGLAKNENAVFDSHVVGWQTLPTRRVEILTTEEGCACKLPPVPLTRASATFLAPMAHAYPGKT